MTFCHYVIFSVNSWYFEFTSKLKQQEKQEKTEESDESEIVTRLVKNVPWFGAQENLHSTLKESGHDGIFVSRFEDL